MTDTDMALTEHHRGTIIETPIGSGRYKWEIVTKPADENGWGQMVAEGTADDIELARAAHDAAMASLALRTLDPCECGGEGFARFSVRVEVVGAWPSWLPVNDRCTIVCRDCAARAAGISGEVVAAAEAIAGADVESEPAPVVPIRPETEGL